MASSNIRLSLIIRRLASQVKCIAGVIALGMIAGAACETGMNTSIPMTVPDGSVSFADHIQPILTSKCAGCHKPGGFADAAGIVMLLGAGESYASLVNQPSVLDASLTLVVPGDAAGSFFFHKVSQSSPSIGTRMPLFAPPLSSAEIELIRQWINEGADNN